ncbi:Lysophospholipase L1 [Amycolatopsis arida]|uniref:Lysophospholipase L1 n=1 Tax=Amycolatopsis arida TaxID=587909 RepID=A0A1I5Q4X1_9PSEU|nr:SGNH/GDSL hydrolase family protein [Amycolatopsis arida]TDX98718.1 lysophospholipase L1-like esterase [Amycolatopsis arida]SFP41229.1 Lysophospholipase L1 [Amycolatopsis arida]
MGYERFVVVGDSCAEGLDDPYPDGSRYRGWADLVASRLAVDTPGLRYANLAVRGRRLEQIITEQLPTAVRLRPDLAVLFGGGNDILSGGFDPATVSRRMDTAIRTLTEAAPTVLVFTLGDFSARLRLARRLLPRIATLNAAVHRSALAHGAHVVDLWPDPAAHDLRYFGRDRLHLSAHGHRRLAGHVLATLGVPFDRRWSELLPGEPVRPGWRDQAEWLYREVLPVAVTRFRNRIVGRSPGDGFRPKRPELEPWPAGMLQESV